MTTGMMDFIMSSGRRTPIDMIPTPDFAVPYAAPGGIFLTRPGLQPRKYFFEDVLVGNEQLQIVRACPPRPRPRDDILLERTTRTFRFSRTMEHGDRAAPDK